MAQCEHTLTCDLSVGNSIDALLLGHMHNAPYLRKNTMLYIAKHGEKVMKLEGWDRVKENAELLNVIPFFKFWSLQARNRKSLE